MASTDEQRFERVYREHEPAVRRYAARRVPADRVDDVVHEAFLAAWRRLDALPSRPLPWLLAAARNVALHEHRSRARQGRLDQRLSAARPPAAPEPEPTDIALALALRALSRDDRELLALIAWDGLSVSDAGHVLGINAVAARVRLHRARRKLHDLLASKPGPRTSPTPSPSETA